MQVLYGQICRTDMHGKTTPSHPLFSQASGNFNSHLEGFDYVHRQLVAIPASVVNKPVDSNNTNSVQRINL